MIDRELVDVLCGLCLTLKELQLEISDVNRNLKELKEIDYIDKDGKRWIRITGEIDAYNH